MVSEYSEESKRTWTRLTIYNNNGTVRSDTGELGSNTNYSRYRNGTNNPKYKAKIAAGSQAATSFDAGKETFSPRSYFIVENFVPKDGKEHPAWWGQRVSQGKASIGIPDYTDHTTTLVADNKAKALIVRKIRDVQTTFQGGVFLGELIESISLITNPARALRNGVTSYINHLKKNGPKMKRLPRRRITEIVRDTWLEYQLGWAPLISEVDSAAEALANHNYMQDRQWQVVRAVGVDEYVSHANSYALDGSGPPFAAYRSSTRYETSVRYIACVGVGSHRLSNWRRVGFAPSNWLPTIWELIPYSFVVDYFTNVGDIISAASLATSDIRWMVKTTRRSAQRKWDPVEPVWLGDVVDRWSVPGTQLVLPCRSSSSTVSRDPYTGSLVPRLEFNLPGCSTQWLNVAALWDARRDLQKWYR